MISGLGVVCGGMVVHAYMEIGDLECAVFTHYQLKLSVS